MARIKIGLALICVIVSISGRDALRLTSLDVPSTVKMGAAIWINCTLDKEDDDLYSVKWYKNDDEFYRYLPRDKPALQKYDIPGIYIDVEKSKEGNVFLRRTDHNTEGTFRCEASAESPTFQTVSAAKELSIYALPTEGPTIQGNLPKYNSGDVINVTCKSGKSKPPATLKWTINSGEAPPHYLINYPPINESDGLTITILGLLFKADSMFFTDGTLTINCTSIVSHVYAMSSERLILGDKTPQDAAAAAAAASEALPSSNFKASDDAPLITGSQTKYRVGDFVNVNCTSANPNPRFPPELNWFINDVQASKNYIVTYSHDASEVPVVGLQFQVRQKHFDKGGELRLKCTATVSKIINTRSEEKVLGSHQWTSGLHASESSQKVTNKCSRITKWKFWIFLLALIF